MNLEEKRSVVERYLDAYSRFDIDAMMAQIHPDVEFNNVSGNVVNATATGAGEFRRLAEMAREMFSSRKQTVTEFSVIDERVCIEVRYEGVLAADLPNGMKAGETLRLNGRSEFDFRDGKIFRITDIS